jgi:hypothetical protein
MDKTKKHHRWKCKDECDVMMFEDSKKLAAVALGNYLDHDNSKKQSKSPRRKSSVERMTDGLKNIFHHASPSKRNGSGGSGGSGGGSGSGSGSGSGGSGSGSDGNGGNGGNGNNNVAHQSSSSRIVELGLVVDGGAELFDPASPMLQHHLKGEQTIISLREKLLHWNESGMTVNQAYLARQLILSAVAEERGAR